MISLTFSSGPWGSKCLKYQNVSNLGSFWAIGKPWERFQSWDIRIYFIPVPKDHTVVHILGLSWNCEFFQKIIIDMYEFSYFHRSAFAIWNGVDQNKHIAFEGKSEYHALSPLWGSRLGFESWQASANIIQMAFAHFSTNGIPLNPFCHGEFFGGGGSTILEIFTPLKVF